MATGRNIDEESATAGRPWKDRIAEDPIAGTRRLRVRSRVGRLACGSLLALALAGCESLSETHDESVLGYLLTALFVVIVGIGVALVVLVVVATLLAASGVLIAWNATRPHWIGRVLGIVVGVCDSLAGAGLLAVVFSLAFRTDAHGGVHVHTDGGGWLAMGGVVLLLLGPATFLAALTPRRLAPTAATPPPP